MARISDAELPARIHALAAPLAEDLGLELEEVDIRGQSGSRKVQLVAHADEGLDVERIARLSRVVGDALEEQDLIPGRYTLEVTSPGADRPLRRPRDFARNVGREVRVVLRGDAESAGERKGELTGVDDDEVRLEIDGAEVTIPFRDVDHGKVVLPW